MARAGIIFGFLLCMALGIPTGPTFGGQDCGFDWHLHYFDQSTADIEANLKRQGHNLKTIGVLKALREMSRGNYGRAIAHAGQTLEHHPNCAACYVVWGMAFRDGATGALSDDEFAETLDKFETASAMEPNCAMSQHENAKTVSIWYSGKPQPLPPDMIKAELTHYRKVLEADPDFDQAVEPMIRIALGATVRPALFIRDQLGGVDDRGNTENLVVDEQMHSVGRILKTAVRQLDETLAFLDDQGHDHVAGQSAEVFLQMFYGDLAGARDRQGQLCEQAQGHFGACDLDFDNDVVVRLSQVISALVGRR